MTTWREYYRELPRETFVATELEYKENVSISYFVVNGFEPFIKKLLGTTHELHGRLWVVYGWRDVQYESVSGVMKVTLKLRQE